MDDLRLSVAVQHHPSRAAMLPWLLDRLPVGAEVVEDPDPASPPSAWRTYRRALELTPADATHRLVIQDDAIPCLNFAAALPLVVASCPDAIVCLYLGGTPISTARRVARAQEGGYRWARINPQDWIPVVAAVIPARLVPEILDFIDGRGFRPERLRSDDYLLGLYARSKRMTAYATVPSLVQHPHDGTVRSLIRRRPPGGKDGGRQAAVWIGDADPTALDWTFREEPPRVARGRFRPPR